MRAQTHAKYNVCSSFLKRARQTHAKYNVHSSFLKLASPNKTNAKYNVCSQSVRAQTNAKHNVLCIFFVLKDCELKQALNAMYFVLKACKPKHTLNTMYILRSKSVGAQTDAKYNVYSSFLKHVNPNKRYIQCIFFVLNACEPKGTLNTMYILRS